MGNVGIATSDAQSEARQAQEGPLVKTVPGSRHLIFWALAVGGCLADLLTKTLVFRWLGMPRHGDEHTWWVIPKVFGFQTSLNEGALFGLGQGFSLLFATLSLAAAAAVLYWAYRGKALHSRLLTVALGCILAGIFGNLHDRLGLAGQRWHIAFGPHRVGDAVYAVRDWILVQIGSYHWPNFNCADTFLVCGAILLMMHALFYTDALQES